MADHLTVTAFHRTASGRAEAITISRLDANMAVQNYPHEWALTLDGFLPADDPTAARRRLLMAPGFEGDVARAKERGVG